MRFPEFEFHADQFPARFRMFGGGCCGNGNSNNSSSSSRHGEAGGRRPTPRPGPRFSQSSCPVGQAAAFIPFFLGPRAGGNVPRNRSSPTAGRSTPQAPPYWSWNHVPDTVLEDSMNSARDVLGQIFGFQYDPSSRGADCSCPGPAQGAGYSSRPGHCGRQTASSTARSPSSPATEKTSAKGTGQETRSTARPSREDKTRERSAPTPSKSSGENKTTASRPSETEKREDVERVSQATLDCKKDEAPSRMKWTQSVSLSGFRPDEVEITRHGNKVHVYAECENSDGRDTCFRRVTMQQIVPLPEDIDQQSLRCTLTADGTLNFLADRKTDLALEKTLDSSEERAERGEALEDKSQKLEALKHEPEKLQTLATRMTEDTDAKCSASMTPAPSTDGSPAEKVETTSTGMENTCDSEEAAQDELHAQSQEADGENETQSPIIQEPEDESSSVHDEDANSVKSFSEDFVIVEEDVNTEDPAEAEDTDPTRPIKRLEDEEAADSSSSNTHAEQRPPKTSAHDDEVTGQSKHPEADHTFRVSLPLEGYSPRDVHVQMEGHTLSIKAHRQAVLGEATYTETVDRRVDLPDHLDLATVRCLYNDDGCLVISAQRLNNQRQVPVELSIM